ncbi:MAG: hypothetical protein UY60_C0033G0008 [Parcubacteria group bacterium GW2011_GWB1_50_9]|nr:MAG: hypothetical protein UY60_C0033G0008 [Parcubacteria group bacterium GW2011_GWB1_50_9]
MSSSRDFSSSRFGSRAQFFFLHPIYAGEPLLHVLPGLAEVADLLVGLRSGLEMRLCILEVRSLRRPLGHLLDHGLVDRAESAFGLHEGHAGELRPARERVVLRRLAREHDVDHPPSPVIVRAVRDRELGLRTVRLRSVLLEPPVERAEPVDPALRGVLPQTASHLGADLSDPGPKRDVVHGSLDVLARPVLDRGFDLGLLEHERLSLVCELGEELHQLLAAHEPAGTTLVLPLLSLLSLLSECHRCTCLSSRLASLIGFVRPVVTAKPDSDLKNSWVELYQNTCLLSMDIV